MKEKELLTGRQAEAGGQTAVAIKLYEKQIAKGYNDTLPYERLLVLYRKQKNYREELHVLNRGITLLQQQLTDHQKELFAKKPQRNKLLRQSRALAQKMGLLDKKGEHLLLPQPLEKWINRKKNVQKKIKAQAKLGNRT
jgi:pantoate kinase